MRSAPQGAFASDAPTPLPLATAKFALVRFRTFAFAPQAPKTKPPAIGKVLPKSRQSQMRGYC